VGKASQVGLFTFNQLAAFAALNLANETPLEEQGAAT
jgi:hypothetical protein